MSKFKSRRAAVGRAVVETLETRRLLCIDHLGHNTLNPLVPGEDPARDALLLPKVDANTFAESAWTQGTKTVLYMRVTFSDKPTTDPQSASSILSMMNTVNQFWAANSFGTLNMVTTVTDLIVLPNPESYYTGLSNGDMVLLADARTAAKAANPAWDYLNYNLDAVRYSGGPGSFSGQAYVGARGVWMKSSSAGVAAHEFGHNLGLWHANYWTPSDIQTVIGPGSNNEYGDTFDTMGSASAGALHFNAWEKQRLDWINPTSNVTTITTDGTYRLHAHDLGGTLNTTLPMGLKIGKDNRFYWLEFRQNSGWSSNPWIMNGVGVRWSPWTSSNGGTQLLDTTPGTPSGKSDSAIVIGRTWTDEVNNIHITPIAKDTSVSPAAIDVRVNFGKSANAPVITNFQSSTLVANVGQTINFSTTASDADGDTLAYHWDFGDNSFGTNSASASKSFASAGEYRVQLTVSDMRGGTAMQSVIIRVGNPHPTIDHRVSGRVTDAFGNPIAGARVTNGLSNTDANYRFALTDSDGTYTLTRLPFGSYNLAASAAGWIATRANFNNPAAVSGHVQNVDFVVSPRVYRVSGKVTLDGTAAVAGAVVSAGPIASEPTNSSGDYVMYLPNGNYTLTASKPGMTFNTATANINFGDVTANLQHQGTAYVAGLISGIPDGEVVTITAGGVSTTITGRTGASSISYFLSGVVPGTYHLSVTSTANSYARSGGNSSTFITVGSQGTNNINFTRDTTRRYTIRGRITSSGEALAGASVSNGTSSVTTDAAGFYQFRTLSAGTYTITPTMSGTTFSPVSTNVTISTADQLSTNFSVTPGNASPTVAQPASAIVAADGRSATLSVLGADDETESMLTYSWSTVSTPSGGTATFNRTGSNSAKQTTATFTRAGTYVLRATIRDARGATTTSNVTVVVNPQFSMILPTPAVLTIPVGSPPVAINAVAADQFGIALPTQPALNWTATGGSIDAAGNFTPGSTPGMYRVDVTSGQIRTTIGVLVPYATGPGGSIGWDRYTGITGSTVANLTSHASYPNSPTSSGQLTGPSTLLDMPTNVADNYGQRLRGYFIAPATDLYTFYIASDDASELWLGTTALETSRVRIASVSGSTARNEWTKFASQQSSPIPLEAGRAYWLEILHKDGTGSDHVSVGIEYGAGVYERPVALHRVHPLGTPIASVAASALNLDEGASTNVRINFSAPIAASTVLRYRVGGTATPGDDFTSLSGELAVSAGATFVDLPVTALADSTADAGETIVLTFDTATGYLVDTANRVTLTITESAPPLTGQFDTVVPNRVTPIDSISFSFARPTTGVDIADLVLTRNNSAISLAGASLQTSDNITFTLSGLTSATTAPGAYELRVVAAGSGIIDSAGQPLSADLSLAWSTYARGDANGDGAINNLDIAPFVQMLTSPSAWQQQFADLPIDVGDVNADGAVNNLDIAPFVALLTSGRSPAPAPSIAPAPTRTPVRPGALPVFSDDEPIAGAVESSPRALR
jgi:hypothetical protein